ncbi:MAG: hypothetical protein WAM95_18225 [Bacillus sp. (in: firmicutes)]
MKIKIFTQLLVFIIALTSLVFPSAAGAEAREKKINEIPTKQELLERGVKHEKVDKLLNKMKSGVKLESDIFLEDSNNILATNENPYFRKEFSDGSFVESTIEDITEEEKDNIFSIAAVEQIGGLQENRTLRVSTNQTWGSQSFDVKVYFPLIGYSKINQAYNWQYFGSVYATDYKGIYRASETASADAVAMQKLVVEIPKTGVRYLAKLEFRMRDGRFWSTYTDSRVIQ